jgi:hypothetical protein
MKEIILNTVKKTSPNYCKYKALVDDEDFEKISQYKWHIDKCRQYFYAQAYIKINGRHKHFLMHKFLTRHKQTDHIDGNGLNNQRRNLRAATTQQNQMNRKPLTNCTSRYKGVSYHKRGKIWQAYIKINGKTIHLGSFRLEIDAAKAYNKKAVELFGEFAKLNNL